MSETCVLYPAYWFPPKSACILLHDESLLRVGAPLGVTVGHFVVKTPPMQ